MKNVYNGKKGFTIIELIVVVATISILATIILVNVDSLRYKAKDATIKQDMTNFFQLALDYLEQHGNFGGFCGNGNTPVVDLFNALPAYDNIKAKQCSSDNNDWVICSKLNFPIDRTSAWCVDKSSVIKEITAAQCEDLRNGLGEDKVCP